MDFIFYPVKQRPQRYRCDAGGWYKYEENKKIFNYQPSGYKNWSGHKIRYGPEKEGA